MRHTAAPFLLATLKKNTPSHPPAHVYVESNSNILLAFLLPKAQLNFTIGS